MHFMQLTFSIAGSGIFTMLLCFFVAVKFLLCKVTFFHLIYLCCFKSAECICCHCLAIFYKLYCFTVKNASILYCNFCFV